MDVVGVHRQQHDRRIGGIHLPVAGLARKIGGELAARGVYRGLDVASRSVDVAIEIELESDVGIAELARGNHLGDAGDPAELVLQWSSDRGGHRFRACAGKIGVNVDGRKIDLRQRRYRKKLEGDDSGKQDRQGNQGGRDRAPNERSGEVGGEIHGCLIRLRRLL